MTSCAPLPRPSEQCFAALAADLRFFRRRPERRYRLRLAGLGEIEMARQYRRLAPTPRGARVFCALRRVSPGSLRGATGFALDVGEVDFDEAAACEAYRRLALQVPACPPDWFALWRADPGDLCGNLSHGG